MEKRRVLDVASPGRQRLFWRTLSISIPTHIALFSILYFGGVRLVETEMVRAHERNSQLLLTTALSDLLLTMRTDSSTREARQRLASFVESHGEIDLHLFSARAELIAGRFPGRAERDEEQREVEKLFAANQSERFWIETRDDRSIVRGVVRIEADSRCVPCHRVGETRGAASITRDLTREIGDVRRRLLFLVVLVVLVWALLTLLVTGMLAGAAERSAERMRAALEAIRNGEPPHPQSKTALLLDPMSLALFESLSRVLRDHQERQEHFASRMHHADRLASLGQLAAGLAHEIKNPLAGIQGALEILRDETSEEATREIHEQMLAELKRVDGTIRALLRFARPSPPRRNLTDVPGLLEEVAQLLRPGLARRGVKLTVESAPGMDSFPLDSQQIRQVIVNLITNAAESIAGDAGTRAGRITLRATVVPEDGSLLLAVEDDGPGIAKEDQKRIFEPFFTSKFTGTGLGLAVVDSLVTQHGGRVELESEPGRGSTFFVILPDPRNEKLVS